MPIDPAHDVTRVEQLEALFGEAGDASLRKEVSAVHPVYRALIEASPFAVLATSGAGGLDASPRGDPPGFVVVEDEKTLLIPERRGNNRIDSLRNLVEDPRIALLFLIPGHGETLRVNGRARLSVDPALLERFLMEGKAPKCVIVMHVDAVYFQCARAIHRAGLWQAAADRPALPTPGRLLAALSDGAFDDVTYDRDLPARQKSTLY